MFLKRGIEIYSAETWLYWQGKWAMRAVARSKISALLFQAGKSQNEKNYKF